MNSSRLQDWHRHCVRLAAATVFGALLSFALMAFLGDVRGTSMTLSPAVTAVSFKPLPTDGGLSQSGCVAGLEPAKTGPPCADARTAGIRRSRRLLPDSDRQASAVRHVGLAGGGAD